MPALKNTLPSYRLHKPSGKAVVTLDGQHLYLGPRGTKVSRDHYDRLVGQWQANGRRLSGGDRKYDITITELIARYWKHASISYRKYGRLTVSWVIRPSVAALVVVALPM